MFDAFWYSTHHDSMLSFIDKCPYISDGKSLFVYLFFSSISALDPLTILGVNFVFELSVL